MKLSIVIICWNDLKVIKDCLASIFRETTAIDFEVIVSDNGSVDDSIHFVEQNYPQVRIVRNGGNLGFARGNNAGIKVATGEYILILNPDTIILDRALEKLVKFADAHPEGGVFGCRVLNPDGSFQNPARPIPTVLGYFVAAIGLRFLGRINKAFESDIYPGWAGETTRTIGYQSGCCMLFRGEVLKALSGFDERFFYHFEETDLCCRVWASGKQVLFYHGAEITHLGGQSVGRFPIKFKLETYRSLYRFFFLHYGVTGVRRVRRINLLNLYIRSVYYRVIRLFRRSEALENRLKMYEVAIRWNRRLDPVRFIQSGEEPDLGYEPLAPAPQMMQAV